jgi:hypothetical protein
MRSLHLVPALLVLGCSPDPQQDSATPSDALIGEVSIATAELMPSVVTVSWTTSEPATSSVDFGAPGALNLSVTASSEPVTEHEAVLVGLVPGTEAGLVIHAVAESGSESSDELGFTTGFLPSHAPWVELSEGAEAEGAGGFFLVPIASEAGSWVCVLDADGVVVWAHEAEKTTRMRALPDGSGLVYSTSSYDEEGSHYHRISWTGEELGTLDLPSSHHDWAVLGDGSIAAIGYTYTTASQGELAGHTLAGDTVVVMDPEGNSETIWDVFEHLDVDAIDSNVPEIPPQGAVDWSHANFVHWDAEQDRLLLTLRHIDAAVSVGASDGSHHWFLSDWGDISLQGEGPTLEWPHSVVPTDQGLLLFNQTYGFEPDPCSFAVELAIDEAAGTATELWRYNLDDCASVGYLGNAEILPNGDRLVVFSQLGIMDVVDPQGQLVRRLQTDFGWEFGYGIHAESLLP